MSILYKQIKLLEVNASPLPKQINKQPLVFMYSSFCFLNSNTTVYASHCVHFYVAKPLYASLFTWKSSSFHFLSQFISVTNFEACDWLRLHATSRDVNLLELHFSSCQPDNWSGSDNYKHIIFGIVGKLLSRWTQS